MIYGIAAALLGLLAIGLAKKMKAFNEKNLAKYEEKKRQKEAARKGGTNT